MGTSNPGPTVQLACCSTLLARFQRLTIAQIMLQKIQPQLLMHLTAVSARV